MKRYHLGLNGAPYAIGADGEVWLYLRYCADATGCRTAMAKSTDGLHFDCPGHRDTSHGPDHPVVLKKRQNQVVRDVIGARCCSRVYW